MSRIASIIAVILLSTLPVAAVESLTFEQHIRPLLKEHCFDCHGANAELEGGLDLRLRRLMLQGGTSGPAIEPGSSDSSLLFQRIRAGEMPPGEAKMPPDAVAVFEKWIASGAATARDEPDDIEPGIGISDEERAFWSFQPVKRPCELDYERADRARTPIDALLLDKMRPLGLDFSPDAIPSTLIRRAYFDLLGLPPSPNAVSDFVNDDSPSAYENLIDRLLASPAYGERWARHWLDVAGYADSEGATNQDAHRPWAYQYRDYVIRCLNNDIPLDQFIQEQLAGDEMLTPPFENLTPDQIDKLAATGFLRMAADGTGSGANDDASRNQTIADTMKIVSTSLLGLSVGCAQCHDHRYDPIPQKDYYQLRAIFEPSLDWKNWRTPSQRLVTLYADADRARAAEIEAEAQVIVAEKAKLQEQYISDALEEELARHPEDLREELRVAYRTSKSERTERQKTLLKEFPSVNISPGILYQYNQQRADELKGYDQRIGEVRQRIPPENFLRVLSEPPDSQPLTHLFHRGDFKQPQDSVKPAGLTITAAIDERLTIAEDDETLASTGRRLAYARWLTNGRHPLLSRVLVNRIWMHHFGRGIVGTPGDFGVLGQRPTHPKLLDWLADELVAQRWNLKRIHKRIMMSTVYRQSSETDGTSERDMAKLAMDGSNELYWKWPLQRLDAEVIRDRFLATTGSMQDQMFGPAVPIKADDAGQVVVDNQSRRSVYVQVKRTQPVAVLRVFDAPVMEVNCDRRQPSTDAAQSLLLMNSDFILEQAQRFAARLNSEVTEPIAPPEEFDPAPLNVNSVWQYGYGSLAKDESHLANFDPFPYWTGKAWQGGPTLPSPELEWAILNTHGGHPSTHNAVIRRWVAPRDGAVHVTGNLSHPSENGNGVRASVVARSPDVAGRWIAFHDEIATEAGPIEVKAGDPIDFVVDNYGNTNSDSFSWPVTVVWTGPDGQTRQWESVAGFHGPLGNAELIPARIFHAWQLAYGRQPDNREMLAALQFLAEQIRTSLGQGGAVDARKQALTNLCQSLLSSNECLYVD